MGNHAQEYFNIVADELAAIAQSVRRDGLAYEEPLHVVKTVALAGRLDGGANPEADWAGLVGDLRVILAAIAKDLEILDRAAEALPKALLNTEFLYSWLRVQEVDELGVASEFLAHVQRGDQNRVRQMLERAQGAALAARDDQARAWATVAANATDDILYSNAFLLKAAV